ncbi:hypothetical protein Ae201684P_013774 [Aphanomyces euteiches]|uniref:Enoyl reductase (ER) domain-containing protein n=1 Tax=Aphanomyces euteiches TaxID=100861 RepID=A0A6G0WL97_9STRA|nr:hypothetical protein Ae201684_013918 [Aphanomyces euteiches]KAH9082869.1 hypothetical protein Ae201684P_013774 [Aphanomyces euteiches]KAH9133502.1 hypothetical protein AeRB84_020441 [Aphanomyces euteiches]
MTNIPKTMRTVGFHEPLPIDNPSFLLDLVIDVPTISGREILVQIKAVNPVDYKLRREPGALTAPKVLGFDAAGVVVVAVGPDATLFKVGDEVYYVGGVTGHGSNAEYQAVNERLAALKPSSLTFSEATGTSPTKSILILNGAGGVGSSAIQLVKELTDVTFIATASWPQSSACGRNSVLTALSTTPTTFLRRLWPLGSRKSTTCTSSRISLDISTLFKPQGKICAINANEADLPFQKLFFQSITFVWKNIITRPIGGSQRTLAHFEASDHAKRFQSTVGQELGDINAGNLRKAHAALEDGHVKGWIALAGFE